MLFTNRTSQVYRLVMLQVILLFFTLTSASVLSAEQAVSYTWNDKELEWGACPAFIPTGCEIAILHGDPAKKNA